MSSYDIFTVRQEGDCYLIVRTYVSHGRLNAKSNAVFNKNEFQKLTEYLKANTVNSDDLQQILTERADKNTLFLANNLEDQISWINVFNENEEPDEDGFITINETNPMISKFFELVNSFGKWSEAK